MNAPGANTNADPAADAARAAREADITAFLNAHANHPDQDLLADMMRTICRLARDGTGRGELKILNTALKELRWAFKVFAPYAHIRKVSIFGSARTPEDHPDYRQAQTFAARISQQGWMVITGGGNGIMRAGHGGAGRQASFGVSIRLPMEQTANEIIADDSKLINFKYFFTRKLMFVKEASAIVCFPGGFGTLDEAFEALTLVQTGKAGPMPIVFMEAPGRTYWNHWEAYVRRELLDAGMISPEDTALYRITDSVDDAVTELTRFYRVYHSSRFVQDLFVIRLNHPLPDDFVARLARDFPDLYDTGTMTTAPGPIDGEDGELPDKPRLIFPFNRQSYGRLRMLINRINDLPRPAK